MFTEFQLGNVRLFEGADWRFDLPPLGIFCGTNSAGKSTVLKVPLLLRQSLGIGESYGGAQGQLRLVGSQVDLGQFASFVSHKDTSRDVTIGVTVKGRISRSVLDPVRWLKVRPKSQPAASHPKSETPVEYTLKTAFSFGLISLTDDSDFVGSAAQLPKLGHAYLKTAYFELAAEGQALLDWNVGLTPQSVNQPTKEPRYHILLPTNYFKWVGGLRMIDVKGQENQDYVRLRTRLSGFLPVGLLAPMKASQSERTGAKRRRPTVGIWPLPPVIDEALRDLHTALQQVHYLGPLRSAAKRYYVADHAVGLDMDATGEFLPYVLRDKKDVQVRSCAPREMAPAEGPLGQAIDAWLNYFRAGELARTASSRNELAVATTKEVLIELNLRSLGGKESHALADSGFGYSQLLPILAKGLLAEVGSTLIIEQPELHLNPALQVRLAEFLVGVARSGKQVLIETHSEHMVNAIRVLAAEVPAHAVPCAVFFIDIGEGRPLVHALSVAEDGTVAGWPRSFFGEAAHLAGRLLRAQKRRLPSTDEPG